MKAAVCPRYGPPDVIEVREVADPIPEHNELLIKIHATTVTSGDCRVRSFTVPPAFWLAGRLALGIRRPKNPIFGSEFAGEVVAIGRNVTRFKVGEMVFGSTQHALGCHAEYRCLPQEGVVTTIPANMNIYEAAALPFGARTALHFLRQANIQPGQSVLINGASGAVGTYAVQLASCFGAVVTGVCSSANHALVRSLGAKHVIDYTREDFAERDEVYDVIFDVVGNTRFLRCRRVLRPQGSYLHAVMVMADIKKAWFELISDKQVFGGATNDDPEYLIYLKGLIEAGYLKTIIDRFYPLEQIVDAHRHVDTQRKRGTLVVTVVPPAGNERWDASIRLDGMPDGEAE